MEMAASIAVMEPAATSGTAEIATRLVPRRNSIPGHRTLPSSKMDGHKPPNSHHQRVVVDGEKQQQEKTMEARMHNPVQLVHRNKKNQPWDSAMRQEPAGQR